MLFADKNILTVEHFDEHWTCKFLLNFDLNSISLFVNTCLFVCFCFPGGLGTVAEELWE